MTAVEIADKKLRVTTRPVPAPAAGEVLIRTAAAGVNRPDILQRLGHYPPPAGVTDIPGLEVSGEIVALGPRVRGWKTGDHVTALVAGGGYAAYCAAPAAQCLPLPKNMGLLAAAALPETFFTVWQNLFAQATLRAGEWLLLHGGAGGIGTTAIRMAALFGARVIATAGSDEKCRACRKLGAARAINYRTQDIAAAVAEETKGRGVDVVLDMLGGAALAQNLSCLAAGGRHVSIAMQLGRRAEIDIFTIMSKRLTLTGSTLRPQNAAVKAAIARDLRKHVWPHLSRGRITPVVDRVFDLAEAQAAHDYLDSGKHIGKVVLRVR